MYPRVDINLNKIYQNTKIIVNMCEEKNINVAGVTKVFCANKEIAKSIIDGGVKMLADSRIENLIELNEFEIEKLLLRLPMISEVENVIKYSDISLNSEIKTINALNQEALNQNKVHKIILMIDLGDLREGIFDDEEIYSYVEKIVKLKAIRLVGIGTNLTCYGGIIPRKENLNRLVSIKNNIKHKYDIDIEIISGGNSSSLHLVKNNEIPYEINNLRIGEAIVLGRETAFGDRINGTYDDCFTLKSEIIEIKEKPSIPIGEIGMDAFGNKPEFIDNGMIKRAICAVGRQDVDISNIIPYDKDISVIGGSSDHLLLDITKSKNKINIGDVIEFKLTYGGILNTMTSNYIKKSFIG